jgi:hypothetical protein
MNIIDEKLLAEQLELWLKNVILTGKHYDKNFISRNKIMVVCREYFKTMGYWKNKKSSPLIYKAPENKQNSLNNLREPPVKVVRPEVKVSTANSSSQVLSQIFIDNPTMYKNHIVISSKEKIMRDAAEELKKLGLEPSDDW